MTGRTTKFVPFSLERGKRVVSVTWFLTNLEALLSKQEPNQFYFRTDVGDYNLNCGEKRQKKVKRKKTKKVCF